MPRSSLYGELHLRSQAVSVGRHSMVSRATLNLVTRSILTLHPGPQQTSQVDFSSFDDDDSAAHMVRSLHLDADEEPRRLNAASRANSVRFDESAKQWNHGTRSSVDLFSRASSGLAGLGGLPMFERSTSHKSEGRQSSAGQSASGRNNSLGLDSSQLLAQSSTDLPGLSPGLMVLGTVPSIVRCWLNKNFKHDALLYAAVCTGSYRSLLELRLIEYLGLSSWIRQDISGKTKIKIPVYLPEAISYPVSSRPNSPAPALPSITVDFLVVDRSKDQPGSKAIQIFLGSDVLRQHSADVMLSSNSLAIYDDDRNKLSVPLVRPENDETFKTLYAASAPISSTKPPYILTPGSLTSQDSVKSLTNGFPEVVLRSTATMPPGSPERKVGREQSPLRRQEEEKSPEPLPEATPEDTKPSPAPIHDRKPSLDPIKTSIMTKENGEEGSATATSSRTTSSPAIWSNWRRDGGTGTAPPAADWAASASRNPSNSYQRPGRELGIKVLKPSTARSTNLRSSGTPSQSPSTPQSRFFDDGRRRAGTEDSSASRSMSLENNKANAKDNGIGSSKARTANPIGGASAFGWLGQK